VLAHKNIFVKTGTDNGFAFVNTYAPLILRRTTGVANNIAIFVQIPQVFTPLLGITWILA